MRAGAALAASTHIATRTTREARVRAAAERTLDSPGRSTSPGLTTLSPPHRTRFVSTSPWTEDIAIQSRSQPREKHLRCEPAAGARAGARMRAGPRRRRQVQKVRPVVHVQGCGCRTVDGAGIRVKYYG